jgi:ABC-2 type transport system permease protein
MTALRNVSAIARKEWRHYFGSPIAYVALVMGSLIFGYFFVANLDYALRFAMQRMGMEFGGGGGLQVNDWIVRPFLRNLTVIGLFIAPMLTMRLVAEEKRQGTLELLATSPITSFEMLFGKFVAALGLYALLIGVAVVNLAVVFAKATPRPDWRPLLVGVLAQLLVGAGFIALGLFISTLTRNQIVAGLVTFGLALLFFVLDWVDEPTATGWKKVLGYLGLTNHLEDLMKGVLDLKDLVFYLSFITFGLFLAHQSVESQRWRA